MSPEDVFGSEAALYPGGGVDEGESKEDAVRLEVAEEAGLERLDFG